MTYCAFFPLISAKNPPFATKYRMPEKQNPHTNNVTQLLTMFENAIYLRMSGTDLFIYFSQYMRCCCCSFESSPVDPMGNSSSIGSSSSTAIIQVQDIEFSSPAKVAAPATTTSHLVLDMMDELAHTVKWRRRHNHWYTAAQAQAFLCTQQFLLRKVQVQSVATQVVFLHFQENLTIS